MDRPAIGKAAVRLVALALALVLAGACSVARTGGDGSSGGSQPSVGAAPPAGPAAPGSGGTGSSGTAPGEPGSAPGDGTVSTGPLPGGGIGPDPGQPQGSLVFPKPGVLAPQPVPVHRIRREAGQGHVIVRLDWVSGVEPCSVLAGVAVARAGASFTLKVNEGSTGQPVACPDIAMDKATLVDLGVLGTGTYTVVARPGDAPPLTVVVP